MEKDEFHWIRRHLNKTQGQMADLLGTSLRAIHSFEQGWRDIPMHVERQVLFLVAMNANPEPNARPCWELEHCPDEWRENCPAYQMQRGDLCWFINGRICRGKIQESWRKKMEICRKCDVFCSTFSFLGRG